MYLLGIGFTVLAIIFLLIDYKICTAKRKKYRDNGVKNDSDADPFYSILGSISAILALPAWCFGWYMVETYYLEPDSFYVLAATVAYGISYLLIIVSFIGKASKTFSKRTLKYAGKITLILFLMFSCVSLLHIAMSCSTASPSESSDPNFAEKVLTPGTDENKFAHDWADKNRKENGVSGY